MFECIASSIISDPIILGAMQIRKQNHRLKSFHLLNIIGFVFLFIFLLSGKVYGASLITDNFDTYTAGVSINGLNGWITDTGDGVATTSQAYSSPNSISLSPSAPNNFYKLKSTAYTSADTLTFRIRVGGTATGAWIGGVQYNQNGTATRIIAVCTEGASTFSLRINMASETENCTTNAGTKINGTDYNKNEWVSVVMSFTGTNENFKVSVNGTQFATDATENITPGSIGFSTTSSGASPLYFDDIGLVSPDGNTTTHIVSITPSSSATTTSPIAVTLNYWVGDDLDTNTSPSVEMYMTNFDTGSTPYKFYSQAVSTTTGLYTINTTISGTLADGFWQISPQFVNSNITSFNQTPLKLGWFLIGATKFDNTTLSKTVTEALGRQDKPYEPCSISDLSGCFKNAFSYLFYPSQTVVEQFKTIDLSDKSPFVYAYQINTLRQEMFSATPTGTTSIGVDVPGFGTLTFLSKTMIDAVPYSSTIKTLLGYLIWIMMAEYIYKRVMRIHDKTT